MNLLSVNLFLECLNYLQQCVNERMWWSSWPGDQQLVFCFLKERESLFSWFTRRHVYLIHLALACSIQSLGALELRTLVYCSIPLRASAFLILILMVSVDISNCSKHNTSMMKHDTSVAVICYPVLDFMTNSWVDVGLSFYLAFLHR